MLKLAIYLLFNSIDNFEPMHKLYLISRDIKSDTILNKNIIY